MDTTSYADLALLPEVRSFEESFHGAVGVSVKLIPPQSPVSRISLGPSENRLCKLVSATAKGCACCVAAQQCLERSISKRRGMQQVSCAAGLTEVAVAVVVGGRHVATLWSGQIMRRSPTQRDFDLLLGQFSMSEMPASWAKDLREAYFGTPVLTAERFTAVTRMLVLFSRFLSETIGSRSIEVKVEENPSVVLAKQFINSQLSSEMTLDSVVRHVSMSRFYFCRLFKKTTGMTLSSYVARTRVERAKELLSNPATRISEIAYAIGFKSIPRFNSLFKLHVGMAPGAFRSAVLEGE